MEDSEKKLKVLEQTVHFSTFYAGSAADVGELEQILSEMKEWTSGRLTCMFGPCEGDGADSLRNLGVAAGKYADVTILTEEPGDAGDFDTFAEMIAAEITAVGGSCRMIPDRVEAIHFLLNQSGKADTVLLLRRKPDGKDAFWTDARIAEEYLETK